MKHILGLIFVVFFLVGCGGSGPDIPNYRINQTDNVGYIIKTNPHMVHTHIGTTIFSNFEKTYQKLVKKDDIEKLLKQNIHANLIDLSSYNFEDLNKLIIESDKKWIVSNQVLYQELITKYKLKAIIIISEEAGGIYMHPTYLSSKSSGLLSQSFLGISNYFAVSGFKFKLNILSPNGSKNIDDLTTAQFVYAPSNSDFQKASGFLKPRNNQNLTL